MSRNGVIVARLKLLEQELAYLRSENATSSFDVYQSDGRLRRAVLHSLQVAIQICLDIGQRICARYLARHPETYADVMVILHQEGVIEDSLLGSMKQMVGFRNLVIHEYGGIDERLVYQILKRRLDDFEDFATAIYVYLQENP